MAQTSDHRRAPRRRGAVLTQAIFEATLAELSEVGYLNLSMERVAQRARTGNASLYRRWPTRAELVLEAIRHIAPDPAELPDTGCVRDDMLSLLRELSALQAGPAGEIMRGIIAESMAGERVIAARVRLAETRTGQFLAVLRRGADRGEVREEAATPLLAGLAPELVMHHYLLHGTPAPDRLLAEIVDRVIMPLAAPSPSPARNLLTGHSPHWPHGAERTLPGASALSAELAEDEFGDASRHGTGHGRARSQ
jgi:AcrR family transcriptional regulator